MNPIRRHAYVCAKCHEGASASFATYVVHEPPPLAASTREGFPLFYYGVWWGLIIVGVTGLMLYNPVLTSDYVPGWLLNVVLWVHRVEAVLAMIHIFTIHLSSTSALAMR